MVQSTKEFRKEITSIFGTLKILVLLFCVIPVIQRIFMSSEGEEILFYNISKMLTFCIIIVVVGVFRLVMNYALKSHVRRAIEILVMYGAGILCYAYTGVHESNYKFIFAIIILIYAMELGVKFGIASSLFSGTLIIVCDMLFCEEKMRSAYFQSDFMLFGTFCFIAYIVGFYVELDKNLIATLNESANRDSLTGLYNHRYFHEYIHENMALPAEEQKHYLFILDIDYFKVYNDTLGHQKGDAVLKKIAEICQETLINATVFRYGGEEFAIHLRAENQDIAVAMANKLRVAIADHKFEGEVHMPGRDLTVCIGLAEKKTQNDTVADWIERADNALYKAKSFRKNRVQFYTSVHDRFDHLDQQDDQDRIVSIKTLLSVIDSRDRYTYNHTDRVVHYCEVYAKYAKLSEENSRNLLYSAYLHDIGKINIPQEILISEKPLTDQQWNQIKQHPSDGADIVQNIRNFDNIAAIVRQHHEKYDGSGYPDGLKDSEIDPLARILTLADSFDAMTSKRPYQKVKTFEDAFNEIRRCSGSQFDPEFAEIFIDAINSYYY